MHRLHVTYDGDQHATAVKEPHHNNLAIDCPFTGKGEEFSPASLLGVSLASCMLLSMGSIAKHHNINLRGTVVDIELTGMNRTFPHVDTINLAFHIPRNFSESDRKTLERAACICPIMGSLCDDTAVTATYDYGDGQAS